MRRLILATALLFPTAASARANINLGTVAYGVRAIQEPDGTISINAARRLWLADGRELRRSHGRWKVLPSVAVSKGVPTVQAVDLAVYPERYTGQRIRITGGRLMYLTLRSATLFVPGASIDVDLSDMPRPQLRSFLQTCGLVGSVMSPFCKRPLVATVTNTSKGDLLLIQPSIAGAPVALPVRPSPRSIHASSP